MVEQHDLTADELARTTRLAWDAQQRLQAGELPDPETSEQTDYADEMDERLRFGRDYLNNLLNELDLKTF